MQKVFVQIVRFRKQKGLALQGKAFYSFSRNILRPEAIFSCEPCNTKYSRKDYYTKNLSSELHKKYTENSDTNDKNKRKNTNKERHVHKIKEWVNIRLQLGNTDEDVAKLQNPPINAS
jgi:hypothetical protein